MAFGELRFENKHAKAAIDERGSKGGLSKFIRQQRPDLAKFLPANEIYIGPDDDADAAVAQIEKTKAKIVRACSALDFEGMVDVVDSHPSFGRSSPLSVDKKIVKAAIEKIREQAASDAVRKFMEYDSGKPYDGKIGIQIWDFMEGMAGSILENPHNKGLYRLILGGAVERTVNDDGHVVGYASARPDSRDVERYSTIVDLYRKIRTSGFVPSSHSFQLEYAFDRDCRDIYALQVRIFKPFQKAKDFDVNFRGGEGAVTLPYNAFGITPEEGIVLPLADMHTWTIDDFAKIPDVAYTFAGTQHHNTTELDVMPRNMATYLPFENAILMHGHYRWMLKSPVTLADVVRHLQAGQPDGISGGKMFSRDANVMARIKANGIKGSIELVKNRLGFDV